MAKYERIVMTEAGLALLENAAYVDGSVQFTVLKTGSGIYDGSEILSLMTDLKNVCQSFGIESVTKKDNKINLRTVINNDELIEGYDMTEIGVYASDPNTEEEMLYAVIIAENGKEDYIPPFADAPASMTFEIYMDITDSETVSFTAAPMEGVYVSQESFNTHVNNSDIHVTKAQLEEIKKSVSDGKAMVAGAITDMGIETATDATFQTLADNILLIESGIDTTDATATAEDILSGEIAYNADGKVEGTMPNNGAVSQELAAGESYTVQIGYHNGSGKVTAKSLASQTEADAVAANILSGKSAWVNGVKITGTMASKAAATYTPTTKDQTIAAGQYLGGVQTIKGDADLVAANIVKGKEIFGVTGTAEIMTNVGNVSRNYYVYKGVTVNAGDFVKTITGVSGIGAGTASVQQLTKQSPYMWNSETITANAPNIASLPDGSVVRYWKAYDSNSAQDYIIQIGTTDFTTNPNIIWGPSIYIESLKVSLNIETDTDEGWFTGASYGNLGAAPISDDGNILLIACPIREAFYSNGVTTYYQSVDLYLYNRSAGTRSKVRTIEGYSSDSYYSRVSGLTYLGNNTCILFYDVDYGDDSFGRYMHVIKYDGSSITYGTRVSLSTGSYTDEVEAWVDSEKSDYIWIQSSGTVYLYSLSGTTLTKLSSVSTSVRYYGDFDKDLNILVLNMSSYTSTTGTNTKKLKYTPKIRVVYRNETTLALKTTLSADVIEKDDLASYISTKYIKGDIVCIGNGLCYITLGANYHTTSSYYKPFGVALLKYDSSAETLTTLHFELSDLQTNYHWVKKIEETEKVVNIYGLALTSPQNNTTPFYDKVQSIINETVTNVNYLYETQVTLATSNKDIEGVAITTGAGGSYYAHNQAVTVRSNV